MTFAPGYLAAHPLPPGIVGALGLSGYQLLADVGGVGAGRLGPQAFLLVAPDPDPTLPDAGTQLVLHGERASDADAAAYVTLAAELGYLRLSGYRIALERHGLRSAARLVDPATGAIAAVVPDRAARGLFGRGGNQGPGALAARLRALGPAGPPPDLADPELLRGVLLALALREDSLGGAEAAELADRALALMTAEGGPTGESGRSRPALDPAAALAAARSER